MKLFIEFPLHPTREYSGDYNPETIPNVGDKFEDKYIVKK